MSNHRKLRYERFLSALVDAQHSRSHMPMQFDSDGNPYPFWNTYEMLVMWKNVNATRSRSNLGPVPFSEIEKAEGLASGHIDYSKKFALYCSNLVDWSAENG